VTLRAVPVNAHHCHAAGAKAWTPQIRAESPTFIPWLVDVTRVKTLDAREYDEIFAPTPDTTEQPDAFPMSFPDETSTATDADTEHVVMSLF
jgi:hypothetical protein